jgi:hypothetical protein
LREKRRFPQAREDPKVSSVVIRLDGLSYLEAIVEAGKKHQGGGGTAAALEAQKTLAVIQIQKQRMGMSAAAATAAASSSGSGGRAAGGVAALPDRKKVSVHAQSRQVDAAGKVTYRFELVLGDEPTEDKDKEGSYSSPKVLLLTIATRYVPANHTRMRA